MSLASKFPKSAKRASFKEFSLAVKNSNFCSQFEFIKQVVKSSLEKLINKKGRKNGVVPLIILIVKVFGLGASGTFPADFNSAQNCVVFFYFPIEFS